MERLNVDTGCGDMIISSKNEKDTLVLKMEGHFDNTSAVEVSLRLNEFLSDQNHLVIDVSGMTIEDGGIQFFKFMLSRLIHFKSITVKGLDGTLMQKFDDLPDTVVLLPVA